MGLFFSVETIIYVLQTLQRNGGILALLLGWIMLILTMNQVLVNRAFMHITREFLEGCMLVTINVVTLLGAFSIIFMLLLNDLDAFQNIFSSFVKVIMWLFGEFNYDDIFVNSKPLRSGIAELMFVLFLIIKCFFFANLAIAYQSKRLEDFARKEMLKENLYWITTIQSVRTCFPLLHYIYMYIELVWINKANPIMNFVSLTMRTIGQIILRMDSKKKTDKSQDDYLRDLEKQVATLVNMCQKQGQEVQGMRQEFSTEIKEVRQQLRHIADKDKKKHSS